MTPLLALGGGREPRTLRSRRLRALLESADAVVFVLGYRAEDGVVRELEGDGPKVMAIGV